MSKKPSKKQDGGDTIPAAASDEDRIEHPQRLRPQRDPYKTRVLVPGRMNGYDVKKG